MNFTSEIEIPYQTKSHLNVVWFPLCFTMDLHQFHTDFLLGFGVYIIPLINETKSENISIEITFRFIILFLFHEIIFIFIIKN